MSDYNRREIVDRLKDQTLSLGFHYGRAESLIVEVEKQEWAGAGLELEKTFMDMTQLLNSLSALAKLVKERDEQ